MPWYEILYYIAWSLFSLAAILVGIVYFSVCKKEKKAKRYLESRVSNDCILFITTSDGRSGMYFCDNYKGYPSCDECKACLKSRGNKTGKR